MSVDCSTRLRMPRLGKISCSACQSQQRDIYFTPEWVALHALSPDAEGKLFFFEAGGHLWVYPFLLLTLRRIGRRNLTIPIRDIESAYGYAGPVSSSSDPAFLSKAWASFSEWTHDYGVVAEFVRLHPLVCNEGFLDPAMNCTIDRETVSIDLERIQEGASPYESKALYMVRRAERAGVQIDVVPPYAGMAAFKNLYRRTMDRLSAAPYYYFSDAYFAGLETLATRSGWLLAAVQDGQWIGAAIFLRGACWMHYHLSAADPDNRVPGVMNLLLHRAAVLGAQEGLLRFHLGGGATKMPQDSLLRFKKSMATEVHGFRIASRVHKIAAYDRLRKIWCEEFPALDDIYGEQVLCYHMTP